MNQELNLWHQEVVHFIIDKFILHKVCKIAQRARFRALTQSFKSSTSSPKETIGSMEALQQIPQILGLINLNSINLMWARLKVRDNKKKQQHFRII
jgi:hypothetical protein